MRTSGRHTRAFTLVELLVVIGIIAVLIGILLPVLSGVQARGRDIKCQSNLRQIVQALFGYAAENKGAMPYGFYYNRSINHQHPSGNPDPYNSANSWEEASDNAGSSGDPDNTSPFLSWASLIGKYMIKGSNGDNDNYSFSPVLVCPEAAQLVSHPLSYVMNMVVAVAPIYEVQLGTAPRYALKPALQTQMLKEGTALVWDTAIQTDWENNVGYLTGADIDGQAFWRGASTPQLRYHNGRDPFGNIPPGTRGYGRPVTMTTQGGAVWKNVDLPPTDSAITFQGNLRFRHNKETACNVGFSDGSVRQFVGKFKGNREMQSATSHDALRKYFMIKWPPGIPADPGQPQ